jgi:hypothetical protein
MRVLRRSRSGAVAGGAVDDGYKWVAFANTTAAVFISQVDGSIVLIAMPAIFRGIGLDPLASANIGYLLWMMMGYRLVQAVLVVAVGRLGDMYGRVRIYNAGFLVFTIASVLLSFDPFRGVHGADCAGLAAGRPPEAREAGGQPRARPNGLPSESRQIAHRDPGWITLPPRVVTRSSATSRSATVK